MQLTRSAWLIYLMLLLPLATLADTHTVQGQYPLQIFSLSGPVCPVTGINSDGDIPANGCADQLLPDVELMLERFDTQEQAFVPVTIFRTNENGYANLQVDQRGIYRVNMYKELSPFPSPIDYPMFLGPVMFTVPAHHFDPQDHQLTPVVVNFDSGIR
jgi:hypothetical protein